MVTANKLLLRPGTYQAPQGELRATPQRVRAWADKFAQMKARGIRTPVCWGHQPAAEPGDPDQRAKSQYWLGAYNAGYLEDMTVDANGALAGKLDCPGCELDDKGNLTAWVRLPDGHEVRTAIGEVSAAIKDWKDGSGHIWKDSIIHVALTPLPVVADQGGFRALSTFAPEGSGGAFYLSLSSLKEGADVPDEKPPEKPEDDIEVEAPVAPAPPPVAETDGARLSECVRVLEAHGIHLPGDTTMANLAERICVAGHAKAKGADDEEEEELDEPAAGEPNAPVVEEQRPVMLSLSTARTERERKLLAREQERHKASQLKRIDRLQRRGMSPAEAGRIRLALSGYQLSMSEDGELVPTEIDRELSVWDRALPSKSGAYLSTHSEAVPRPFERDESKNRQAQEEAGDELAALAGAPAKKK